MQFVAWSTCASVLINPYYSCHLNSSKLKLEPSQRTKWNLKMSYVICELKIVWNHYAMRRKASMPKMNEKCAWTKIQILEGTYLKKIDWLKIFNSWAIKALVILVFVTITYLLKQIRVFVKISKLLQYVWLCSWCVFRYIAFSWMTK